MPKNITKKIISLWLFFIIFTLILPLTVFAATGSTVPAKQACAGGGEHNFCLNIPIGQLTGFDVGNNNSIMGDYIKSWYGFMLGSVGILATVMIMWGGFKYLISRGDKASIESAKTQMISATTGVVLAFGTYTLLYLINPALLTINTPNLPGIQGGENVTLAASNKYATADPGTTQAPCSSAPTGNYNLANYNPSDCNYPAKLTNTANTIGKITTAQEAENYIKQRSANSPITGDMVMATAQQYGVDPALLLSIMQNESNFADVNPRLGGMGASTYNPGNVGNWPGHETNLGNWPDGVNAIGAWLNIHKN